MASFKLTDDELDGIVRVLAPQARALVAGYDGQKYPKDAYEELVRAFMDPTTTSGGDIRRALEWKYGHWGKANYPQPHRDMAQRIWSRWGDFCSHLPLDPPGIFDFWMKALEGRWTQPYITVAFLLHLLRSSEFPIIDQFTYRAMNALVRKVQPDWDGKRTPSSYDDLLDYMAFFDGLLRVWPAGPGKPVRSRLDKALMVFGQGLKTSERHPGRRTQ